MASPLHKIIRFLRSPRGRRLIAQAKRQARDPRTRHKVNQLMRRARGRRY